MPHPFKVCPKCGERTTRLVEHIRKAHPSPIAARGYDDALRRMRLRRSARLRGRDGQYRR